MAELAWTVSDVTLCNNYIAGWIRITIYHNLDVYNYLFAKMRQVLITAVFVFFLYHANHH